MLCTRRHLLTHHLSNYPTYYTQRWYSQIPIFNTKNNHNSPTSTQYNNFLSNTSQQHVPKNNLHPPKRWYSSQISLIGTENNNNNIKAINGLHFQHQFMNNDEQQQLLDELYTLNSHVWRVRNKEEEPISGVKYDQFLLKSSDLFGRTVIHIYLGTI